MEKISGILPSNARIRSVDLSDSAPPRSGVPRFDSSSQSGLGPIKDRFTRSSVGILQPNYGVSSNDWKVRDMAKASVADEISRSFFQTRVNSPVTASVTDSSSKSSFRTFSAPTEAPESFPVSDPVNSVPPEVPESLSNSSIVLEETDQSPRTKESQRPEPSGGLDVRAHRAHVDNQSLKFLYSGSGEVQPLSTEERTLDSSV